MSPELKQALQDILKMVEEKRRPKWFNKTDGLCFTVEDYGRNKLSYDFGVQLRKELEELFVAEGLSKRFPFNNNCEEFWDEVKRSKNLRWKNPKRMAWLKEHAQ